MRPLHRTFLGVAAFIPLAAILLATFACLPAPVGDPETAKIDDTITGAYKGIPTDPADKGSVLALLRPWDGHTYLLQYMTVGTKDGKEDRHIENYKAWLTTLAGKTFITAQPMDDLQFAIKDDGDKPYWVVLRLDNVDSGLEARIVSPDSEFVKGLTKREELEAAIKAHAGEKALYGDPITFKKLGKDDKAFIEETMSHFNTGSK